jgi:hypothetical protein
MAGLSHELTQKRFGKTLQMYIPSTCPINAATTASIAGSGIITKSNVPPLPWIR